MRKLKCFQISGLNVQEVLDEFNERAEEFKVKESDIVSVSALPPTTGIQISTSKGTAKPKVEVVIVYWAKDDSMTAVLPDGRITGVKMKQRE